MPDTPRLLAIRPFTVRIVNPVTRLFAGWLPGFGILEYQGRQSGRRYRTPASLFWRGDHIVIALTYGSGAQWVRNVRAAGGCDLRTRGHDLRLGEPELIVDPSRRLVPRAVRLLLGPLRVTEFLRLRILPSAGADGRAG